MQTDFLKILYFPFLWKVILFTILSVVSALRARPHVFKGNYDFHVGREKNRKSREKDWDSREKNTIFAEKSCR